MSQTKHLVWFAGGAATEFQRDDGRYVAGALCERRVMQQQLIVLLAGQFDPGIKPFVRQRRLDDRLYVHLDPVR